MSTPTDARRATKSICSSPGRGRSFIAPTPVFSTWKANSPMSRLRRGEITARQAPPEVTEVLELAPGSHAISRGGWFDPWAMPGGVDPTGYVKGWAAQSALAELPSSEMVGAMVNAAGDIASFGGAGRPEPFRIGIVDPFLAISPA